MDHLLKGEMQLPMPDRWGSTPKTARKPKGGIFDPFAPQTESFGKFLTPGAMKEGRREGGTGRGLCNQKAEGAQSFESDVICSVRGEASSGLGNEPVRRRLESAFSIVSSLIFNYTRLSWQTIIGHFLQRKPGRDCVVSFLYILYGTQ